MRLALCNEVLAAMPLERQCEHAAALGYDGLEIAPYTLFDRPDEVTANEASRARNVVESAGLAVTSLHWLLARPAGLSLTDPDASTRSRTLEAMTRLTGLCAALGGNVLEHCLPTNLIAHVQINDPNRRAPGQGDMRFAPIAATLARHGYAGTVAVEPFDYVPDGAGAAAFAAGYWRGVREALD